MCWLFKTFPQSPIRLTSQPLSCACFSEQKQDTDLFKAPGGDDYSSDQCFFFFACFCLFCLMMSKETWYWDSSNVTEMVMSGVKCTGTEMALSQCQHHKTVSCQKAAAKFAAGVICSESESKQKEKKGQIEVVGCCFFISLKTFLFNEKYKVLQIIKY